MPRFGRLSLLLLALLGGPILTHVPVQADPLRLPLHGSPEPSDQRSWPLRPYPSSQLRDWVQAQREWTEQAYRQAQRRLDRLEACLDQARDRQAVALCQRRDERARDWQRQRDERAWQTLLERHGELRPPSWRSGL